MPHDLGQLRSKTMLRQFLKQRRQHYVFEHKNDFMVDLDVISVLVSLAARAGCIGGYVSTRSEADPGYILQHIARGKTNIALPYIAHPEAAMEFRKWQVGDVLERAPFGFYQPLKATEYAVPDIVFVPLVGFDRNLNRLGQGAGHYDRYFSNNINSLRIGLAFSFQEVSQIPADHWDVPLDAVLTEKEWIVGANSRIAP
jgi:5-formyltetrahydrofolate cyclo-ligase